MLKKLGRILVFIIAVLFIVVSIAGIVGAWWGNSIASNVTLKAFAVVETGVSVVDAGVGRIDTLIITGRSEVQQADETIAAVSGNMQANNPVLTALSERLETRLGPTIDSIQEAVAPVREALTGVSTAVSIANSIPFVRERAPAVEKIDAAFNQVGELAADARQLRSTLRAAATGQADQLTEEAATTLTNLTSRIDSRLAEIQANVEEVQAEIQALQVRLENLKKTVLLIFNLLALLATLLFLWVIYSQFVVIRHHARLFREPAASAPALAAGSAETSGRAGDGQAVQPSDEVAAPVPAALAPAADAPAAIKPPEETAGGSGEAPAGEPLAEAPAETAPDAQPPEAQPPNVGA